MTGSLSVAVAGKGGTGKTTIAALLLLLMRERGDGPVLAVDADPNENLGGLLGLAVRQTIGELREDVLTKIAELPPGVSKDRHLEYGLHQCLVEGPGVDLLVMGRGEGPKCYCMVNHILRKYVEVLSKNYRYIVFDNEAGMEHLSRRTTQDMDVLLVAAREDPVSLRAAGRIAALARELGLRVGDRYLLLSDVQGEPSPEAAEEVARLLPTIGRVPHDDEVVRLARAGRPLGELSLGSPARTAMAGVLDRLLRAKEFGEG
ncbi:MAG: AAA family ATPase [Candidatus Bipolaricaulota bacterium]